MDFNIGQVQHFTSQGIGVLYSDQELSKENCEIDQKFIEKLYEIRSPLIKSSAKVVMSGLGADELFAGYKRYKAAFLRGGETEHLLERSFDLKRLWLRNLGRDDRVISGRSKEARFPFLELDLQELVMSIKECHFADYSSYMPKNDEQKVTNKNNENNFKNGDKLLQREIGKNKNQKCCDFDKRAMQFGSGVAKVLNKEKFGSTRRGQGKKDYCDN